MKIFSLLIIPQLLASSLFLHAADAEPKSDPIPFSEIGAKATADYKGDAIGIRATPGGAELHTGFQKLSGIVTVEGLRLDSTAEQGGGLHLMADTIGRRFSDAPLQLPRRGSVSVGEKLVTFTRPGLTEEYSVSADGVRQDFIVAGRPDGTGELWVELAFSGARAEPAAEGAKLILDGSGRELAYSRLHVLDALGNPLSARIEVVAGNRLAVRVDDTHANYPIRIDPTFSDFDWDSSLSPGYPGANNTVNAAVVDASGNVYIGGSFSFVGTAAANGIAKWDGSTWSALGSGIGARLPSGQGSVASLAAVGTDIYVGGSFIVAGDVSANSVAKWNGTSWSALGLGVHGSSYSPTSIVTGLAAVGGNLYAVGNFTFAGLVPASNIAKWDGSGWSALGAGVSGVNALAVIGTDLYVGGSFTAAGGVTANRIAKWDGTTWSALGSGMDSTVYALALNGTDLYAGGAFTTAGGVTANRIAKWDGTTWSAVGPGMDNNSVTALSMNGTDLYAGGSFTTAGGVAASRIAKWNGSNWSALGAGPSGSVIKLAVIGSDLYAIENIIVGTGTAGIIEKWNGSTWSAVGTGSGMTGTVNAIALIGSDLYAGGTFTNSGGASANYIAKWNGSTWSTLGSGLSVTVGSLKVSALAVSGTDLYAGGSFTTAGGVTANRIAKWNGNAWSALGSGLDNTVNALALIGTNLYAGGNFTTAGGVTVNYISKWNGSAWSALGSGMNSSVQALASNGTDLYAGGGFTTAGGVTVNYISKWNGSAWSALGSGLSGSVYALASNGTDLYAGGYFTAAGGVAASRIAKWNGTAWSALGSGVSNGSAAIVTALCASESNLYVGGDFTSAGGMAANYIAKWNGSNWSAFGSGLSVGANNQTGTGVLALAVNGTNLYTGGNFMIAGTTVSPFLVRGNLAGSPPTITAPAVIGFSGTSGTLGANVTVQGSDAVTSRGVVIAPSVINANPQLGGAGVTNVAATGSTGAFTVKASGLTPATAYSFAAYATNSIGTSYTTTGSFTTLATSSPDISVDQPAGSPIGSGGVTSFAPATSTTPASMTFTINNPGSGDLTGLGVTIDGVNAADFTVTSAPSALVIPGDSTAFTVRFAPPAGNGFITGARNAALHVSNNVAGKSPYNINLSGQGLSTASDNDSDGQSDASEFDMAALGFDWQVSQPGLVNNYHSTANEAGYYSLSQVQSLNVNTPLIQRDPGTGQFKLTLGIEKSTNLSNFSPFPFTTPQTSINGQGKIELLFTSPDNAAFFRLNAK